MKTEVVQQLHNKDEKKVILMRKSHSPHEVVFSPDLSDNHFFNVILRKVKTGAEVTRHYILRADLAQWIGVYQRDGFEIVEPISEKNG
jgi:hypothetical protein